MFAVKHSPFDMIPQVCKAWRGWPQTSGLCHALSSPGTFSRRRYEGRFASASRAISKKRVPLASSNPFLWPARENAWQGNPPQRRSKSGRSLGSILLVSGSYRSSFSDIVDGAVTGLGMLVDLAVADALETHPHGSGRPESRRSRRTCRSSGSGNLISLLQARGESRGQYRPRPRLLPAVYWFWWKKLRPVPPGWPPGRPPAVPAGPDSRPPFGTPPGSAGPAGWRKNVPGPPLVWPDQVNGQVQPPPIPHGPSSGRPAAHTPWRSGRYRPG